MHYTTIDGNGNFKLTITEITQSPEVTVYAPADIGSATIEIGYLDSTGTFNAYLDGSLGAGESKRVRCGEGVELVANVSGHTTNFDLGYAN